MMLEMIDHDVADSFLLDHLLLYPKPPELLSVEDCLLISGSVPAMFEPAVNYDGLTA